MNATNERGCWCTPPWLTALLPVIELDPCSNPRSTVRASRTYSLENGQDGLALPWDCSVFVNPDYSDVHSWALKLLDQSRLHAAGFLVNVDSSTVWWSLLTERLEHVLLFHKRIQFDPPPGIKPSTNSKPQALLMNDTFLSLCSNDLLVTGTLWSCSTSYRTTHRTAPRQPPKAELVAALDEAWRNA